MANDHCMRGKLDMLVSEIWRRTSFDKVVYPLMRVSAHGWSQMKHRGLSTGFESIAQDILGQVFSVARTPFW